MKSIEIYLIYCDDSVKFNDREKHKKMNKTFTRYKIKETIKCHESLMSRRLHMFESEFC